MKATLVIEFEDGTSRVIDLGEKCVEIDLGPERRQSLAVSETIHGKYVLSFTSLMMERKKFKSITIRKEAE